MSWYAAPALEVFRKELNAAYPNRDKTSDGAVGDTAHAARKSDHNPSKTSKPPGVVRARDFDKDGIPADLCVKFLLDRAAKKDPRMGPGAYVIWNRVIWSYARGWVAHEYTGTSPHDHHFHFSICLDEKNYDSTAPWGLAAWIKARTAPAPVKTTKPAPTPVKTTPTRPVPPKKAPPKKVVNNPHAVPTLSRSRPVLKEGARMSVDTIKWVQWACGLTGRSLDGNWGPQTTLRVKNFQTKQKLLVDGQVGPQTLAAMKKVTR